MNELETAIREIAKEVYSELGSGHTEAIYRSALEVSLRLRQIRYERERPIEIMYQGHCVGRGQADLIVGSPDRAIIVELKAVPSAIGPSELQQLRNYMKALRVNQGLLINFPQPDRPRRKNTSAGPHFEIVAES